MSRSTEYYTVMWKLEMSSMRSSFSFHDNLPCVSRCLTQREGWCLELIFCWLSRLNLSQRLVRPEWEGREGSV